MITLASLFCGFNAMRILWVGNADAAATAALFLLFAILLDLLDGRVARLTHTESAFGLQLDSLVDLVSFGVAPAFLMYTWVFHRVDTLGLLTSFGFLACAAARLARFNVLSTADDGKPLKPSKYITGLPVPPACGLLLSLVITDSMLDGRLAQPEYRGFLVGMTWLLALLMVSNVQFRSFKDLKLTRTSVLVTLFAIASSALVWQRVAPAFVLTWLAGIYISLGIFEWVRALPGKFRDRGGMQAHSNSHHG